MCLYAQFLIASVNFENDMLFLKLIFLSLFSRFFILFLNLGFEVFRNLNINILISQIFSAIKQNICALAPLVFRRYFLSVDSCDYTVVQFVPVLQKGLILWLFQLMYFILLLELLPLFLLFFCQLSERWFLLLSLLFLFMRLCDTILPIGLMKNISNITEVMSSMSGASMHYHAVKLKFLIVSIID